MSYGIMWLVISGVLLIIEIFTISFLLFFPGISAFISFIAYLLGANIYIQVVIFAVSSTLMILFVRPLITRFFKSKDIPMNSNFLIGKTGIILKDIGPNKVGQVKVSGEIWSAITKEGNIILKDSEVKIIAIDGVKLVVENI